MELNHSAESIQLMLPINMTSCRNVATTVCLFAFALNAQAGVLTITSPSPTSPSPKAGVALQFAISRWKAKNEGVTFGASAAPQHGSVVGWLWNFPPGTLGGQTSSTLAGPGPVIYPDSAYGSHNPATVGVKHTVPDPNNPNDRSKDTICQDTGTTVATVNVNVVKPQLSFNTAKGASYDPEDSGSGSAFEQALKIWGVSGQLPIGVKLPYGSNGQPAEGCPYEYKYDIAAPGSSGAKSDDMAIYESAALNEVYYKGTTRVYTPLPITKTAVYHPGGFFSFTKATPPDNPRMFAVDIPGIEGENDIEKTMSDKQCNRYVGFLTLTSYPLFQDPTHIHLDNDAIQSHLFTFTATKDSSGKVTWDVTP